MHVQENKEQEGERRESRSMYVCASVCWYMCMCAGTHGGQKRTLDPLELQALVSFLVQVQGIECGSSARAVCVFKYSSVPPIPQFFPFGFHSSLSYYCFQIMSLSGLCEIILFSVCLTGLGFFCLLSVEFFLSQLCPFLLFVHFLLGLMPFPFMSLLCYLRFQRTWS